MKSFDPQRTELQQALEKATGPNYVHIPSMNISIDPTKIPAAIRGLENSILGASDNRQKEKQRELDYLRDEVNRSEVNEKVRQFELGKSMEALDQKRMSVSSWRQANRGAAIVGPLHWITDVGLPILIGLGAIGFLTWFLFHLPPPPIPVSWPEV